MGSIGNGVINTFVDGDIVSATGTSPALLRSALNPKMQIIQAANDDNNTRIGILEGQLIALGTTSVRYNVKAAPFNAVGDGIADDTVAIQAAITQAVANQGIVVFPTGTYKITDTLNIYGACTLASDGTGTGVVIKQITTYKRAIRIRSSNVTIKNLSFDQNGASGGQAIIETYDSTSTSYFSNIYIQYCSFYTTSGVVFQGIYASFCSNINVTDCLFTGYSTAIPATGASFSSCSNINLLRNSCTNLNSGFTASRISLQSLANSPQSEDVIISENTFYQCVTAVYLASVKNAIVLNNSIVKMSGASTYYGINCYATQDNASNSIYNFFINISKNYIDNSLSSVAQSALYLSTMNNCIVDGNIFVESGGSIRTVYVGAVNGVSIINNIFKSCQNCGIDIISGASSNNMSICNNIFEDIYTNLGDAYAINSYSTATQPITISGNQLVRGTKSATYVNSYGLYIQASSTALYNIFGNIFRTATIAPFYVGGFQLYYEEPSSDRVFYSPTGVAPTTGTWRRGDKVLIDDPSAGGYIGYICTTAGSPGTWKGYGAIQV